MIDIALEVVRALVLLGIVLFLWTAGRGRFELTRTGWNCIIGGFGLLLFGSLVDITDNFEYLNRFVVIGDTETEAILEKFVGFLGGFVLLAFGLVRWIPSVQRLSDEIDKGGRTAEALRASETQVRLLMDSTAEAIYGIDLKGDCSFANPACAEMLGYDNAEEFLGKHMHDLIHHTRPDGTHYPVSECLIYLAAKRGEGTHVENEVLWRRDGSSFPAEYWAYPVYRDGKIDGVVVTFLDITVRKRAENELRAAHDTLEQRVRARTEELEQENAERKRAEETLRASEQALQEYIADLEEAQRKLEIQGESLVRLADDLLVARDEARGADRAKSEFLAAMSHELRTPLNAVIGFSEIIKDETFGPVGSPRYRDYAKDINDSGQHLLGLINDLLDLSKIESGTEELHEDTIEIPGVISSALKLVEHRAEQLEIKLELELQGQLPALRADERKLKQILVNLLSNAIKFTDAGGEVTLKAWYRRDSGYVFQIADTGIGIAPENIPKALSRFGQIDADLNRQYEGTGLGLPLTKALVEQHGGTLDLLSEVNVGTIVTVRFPAERSVNSSGNYDSLGVKAKAAS